MADERWDQLRAKLEELTGDYRGRVDYGDLRLEVYDGGAETPTGGRIAVAYETPGGSTNQFGVGFEDGRFEILDAAADRVLKLEHPDEVVDHLARLIQSIPEARAERLRQDIDQMLAEGSNRRQVIEELNRLMRLGTEFRGGSLTVDELTGACRYLVQRTSGA